MKISLRNWSLALFMSLGVITQSIAALSHEDLKNVQAISVDKDVPMPKTMSYLGPDQGIGLLFGGVGGAIEGATNQAKRPEQAIVDFAAENHIVIQDIVRQETIAALNKSGLASVTDDDANAGAKLKIEIKQYGLFRKTLFTKKLVPVLYLKYTLTDTTGKILWDDSYRVLPLSSPAEPTALEDIKANPAVLENLWRTVAQALAKKAFPPAADSQKQ